MLSGVQLYRVPVVMTSFTTSNCVRKAHTAWRQHGNVQKGAARQWALWPLSEAVNQPLADMLMDVGIEQQIIMITFMTIDITPHVLQALVGVGSCMMVQGAAASSLR